MTIFELDIKEYKLNMFLLSLLIIFLVGMFIFIGVIRPIKIGGYKNWPLLIKIIQHIVPSLFFLLFSVYFVINISVAGYRLQQWNHK